jgi:hypothetical protein
MFINRIERREKNIARMRQEMGYPEKPGDRR